MTCAAAAQAKKTRKFDWNFTLGEDVPHPNTYDPAACMLSGSPLTHCKVMTDLGFHKKAGYHFFVN